VIAISESAARSVLDTWYQYIMSYLFGVHDAEQLLHTAAAAAACGATVLKRSITFLYKSESPRSEHCSPLDNDDDSDNN